MNDVCPACAAVVSDGGSTIGYNGFDIRVCGPACQREFTAMPTRRKDAFVGRFVEPVRGAGAPARLVSVDASLQPVIDQFNADKDKPRIVALLSPTCGGCIHGAKAILEEAVKAYPDDELSILVVWEPMLGSDNETAARESASIFDDPRVHQFWDPGRLSGITYSTKVFPNRMRDVAAAMPADHFLKGRFEKAAETPPEQIPMWDFALFYPPGVVWANTPPRSSNFVRQLAIYRTSEGTTSATLLVDDFTRPPIESDWFDEVRREMATLMGTKAATQAPTAARRVAAPGPIETSDSQFAGAYPDSPTGRAAKALVELTSSSGEEALREFVESKLSPGARERNSDAKLLEAFGQIRDHLTNAELRTAKRTGPFSAELLLASDQTGTVMTMTIELEPEPPHRIDRVTAELRGGGDASAAGSGFGCVAPPTSAAGAANALGVTTTAPSAAIAAEMQLANRIRTEGRVVTAVEPNSSADRAGVQTGDVVLQLAGNRLYSADDVDDFLSAAEPGKVIEMLVKRAGSTTEERLPVTIASGPQRTVKQGIDWQFAGLGQLEEALSRARASDKPLLVGLSGSDTCCDFSRFEVASLSQIVDDPRIVEGSRGFVSIIIRRPHAYWFLEDVAGLNRHEDPIIATPRGLELSKGGMLPIPSIFFLDPDRAVLGNVALAQPGARETLLRLMQDLASP